MISKKAKRQYRFSYLNSVAHTAMDWIGSIQSLVIHTLFFAASFLLVVFGIPFEKVLLVVTTIVSLEAIYLAIFIQMAVNQNTQSLETVEEDIDEIQEDVEEIQEDVEEIEKDVDVIQEDVDVIQKDVDEIEKDIDEIQKDVDEIEKDESQDEEHIKGNKVMLEQIEGKLAKLTGQIEKMKLQSSKNE